MPVHVISKPSSHHSLATFLFVVVVTVFMPSLLGAFQYANLPHTAVCRRQITILQQQHRSAPPRRIRIPNTERTELLVQAPILQKVPFLDSYLQNRQILRIAMPIILAILLLLPKTALASSVGPGAMEVATSSVEAVATAAPTLHLHSVFSSIPAAMELRLSIRLLYAALMGAALGKERSFAKHSAGVRTMSLVSMGAAAFTVCSQFGFSGHSDTGRVAANVVSGVGFVGAGVITTSARNQQNIVHGLTTAATIWLSAAVGMACGVGLFRIATTTAVATLFILRMGRKKPKTAPFRPFDQFSSAMQSFTKTQVEADDLEAKNHVISEWNETPHEDEAAATTAKSVKATAEVEIANGATTDQSDLMEEVVRLAWQNATLDYGTLVSTERVDEHFRSKSDHRPGDRVVGISSLPSSMHS